VLREERFRDRDRPQILGEPAPSPARGTYVLRENQKLE
jgi:hypothetical protein